VILDEIVLHNFGIYHGRHSVRLTPPSPQKPVILIGGLNGGGKTTFLDAIHTGLYGKRARTSNRGSLGYDEYLRRSINRRVDPTEGAAIEVQFRQRAEGVEHTFRVQRSWSANARGVTEHTEILRDGALDRVLTDGWNEVIEESIPVSMSHLFFFDGEKIEGFADIENSTQLLSKAVYSLLGLDLVDRLASDLVVLESRQRTSLKNTFERKQLEEAEKEVQTLEALRADLVEQRAAKQNEMDRLEKRLKDAEAHYANEGGQLFDSRHSLREERLQLQVRLQKVEDRLRDNAAGVAPLLLVLDLLSATAEQGAREEAADQARSFDKLLSERDSKLLKKLSNEAAPKKMLSLLKTYLADERAQRTVATKIDSYLHLSTEGREGFRRLDKVLLARTYDETMSMVREAEGIQSQLITFDRKLAGVPDQEKLQPIIKQLEATRAAIQEAMVNLAALDMEIKRITRERDQKKGRWLGQAQRALGTQLEHNDVQRVLSHSKRVKQTLQKFRVAVVERHVGRIERLILESFRQLLRKKSLISALHIDPQKFSLELLGADGQTISPDRLSAGERQLLAVSMLWGLARASGRPLPTVIDTPLGRLDATHRINLVERYFPYASHQVLLLSTDEEIDEGHYQTLKPSIGHTYKLEYDDAKGVTSVKSGYFW
jgi:DNA sulfur modification protein DndD